MGLSPYDEAVAAQTGKNVQAISPSEEAELLAAEEAGVCPTCKRPLDAVVMPRAPF